MKKLKWIKSSKQLPPQNVKVLGRHFGGKEGPLPEVFVFNNVLGWRKFDTETWEMHITSCTRCELWTELDLNLSVEGDEE